MKKILGIILMGGVVVVMALNVSLNTPNVRNLTLFSIEALANESGPLESWEKKTTRCITGNNFGICKENITPRKGMYCIEGRPIDCEDQIEVELP